jgi:hypothetical protein
MNPQIQLRKATQLFIVVVCFGFSPAVWAVNPPPDGGYPNGNTAEGFDALFSLTTGVNNTAIGFGALFDNTTGVENMATGAFTLESNTTGSDNTANGFEALQFNTSGVENTANGAFALEFNTIGFDNTASGAFTLESNTTGNSNTATGSEALNSNTTGINNTATGFEALEFNTTGNNNTANGFEALNSNTTGSANTATGLEALEFNTTGHDNLAEGYFALENNTTGSSNIAVGYLAGQNLTTGSNNIDIGANVLGNAGEANTIRIGKQGTQRSTFIAGIYPTAVIGSTVVINSNGKLGVAASSARFKEQIKPMDNVSEAILALQPVTFRYTKEIDPERTPQFGLVAEDVDKIDPELVVHDEQGKPYTVRYDAVNAMLLNEFVKEHRTVQEQGAMIACQQKQIDALTAGLQKVSAQFELSKSASRTVLNGQ